jgi:hypothetical protein
VLQGGADLTLPKASIFSLTEGYKLHADGTVAVGTTATGQSVIPNAHLALEAGRSLEAKKDDQAKGMLDQARVDTAGFQAASIREVIALTFDRSIALDRPWDVSAGYGRELSVTGPLHGVTARALVEGGVGGSGAKTLPYLRLKVGAQGYVCKPIHGEKHLLCAEGNVAASAGLVQTQFDIGLGADYRYVTADRSDTKSWVHSISVGPSFQQSVGADLAGGHAATQGMFSLTIR